MITSPEIQKLFNRVAPKYDLLNRLLSARRDVLWRRAAARLLAPAVPGPILDLACGTFDLSLELAGQLPGPAGDRLRLLPGDDQGGGAQTGPDQPPDQPLGRGRPMFTLWRQLLCRGDHRLWGAQHPGQSPGPGGAAPGPQAPAGGWSFWSSGPRPGPSAKSTCPICSNCCPRRPPCSRPTRRPMFIWAGRSSISPSRMCLPG